MKKKKKKQKQRKKRTKNEKIKAELYIFIDFFFETKIIIKKKWMLKWLWKNIIKDKIQFLYTIYYLNIIS